MFKSSLGFDLGLITGENAFQDGTKIRASASNAGFKTEKEWKEILSLLGKDLQQHFDALRGTDNSEDEFFDSDHPGEGFISGSRDGMYARVEEAVAKAKKEKAEQEKKRDQKDDSERQDAELPDAEFDGNTLENMEKALRIWKALDISK